MAPKKTIPAVSIKSSKSTQKTINKTAKTTEAKKRKRKVDETSPPAIKYKKIKAITTKEATVEEQLENEEILRADERAHAKAVVTEEDVAPLTRTSIVKTFGKIQKIGEFHLGTIFSSVSHETLFEEKGTFKTDPNLIAETRYGKVVSKVRKLVVIARYSDHMTCIPIYSHNGLGLKNKPNNIDFVGIRDVNHHLNSHTESPFGNVYSQTLPLGRRLHKKHPAVINEKSYVQITRPTFFLYDVPCIIESRLLDDDLKRLIDLVNGRKPVYGALPGARDPPARQRGK